MQTRGQRALHPRQVARRDPDATARIEAVDPDELAAEPTSRHRRPTVRMSPLEIERAIAEAAPRAPTRTRLARGSGQHDVTPPPVIVRPVPQLDLDLDLDLDDAPDPGLLLLPFRARRPVLATALTAALAAAFLLALHHIIAAG